VRLFVQLNPSPAVRQVVARNCSYCVRMINSKVLFLCSTNSCRTQMAEALLHDLAGGCFGVVSGGAETGPLEPDEIQVVRAGHRYLRQSAKDISQFFGQRFNHVISLCDRQRERSCPIFPNELSAAPPSRGALNLSFFGARNGSALGR
jgi:low molecular weight phosphotyrosine protein phosphatase